MKLIAALLAVGGLASAQPDIVQQDTKSLIARVRENPEDLAAIGVLAKRSDDSQVIPTLRDAFTSNKISGARVNADPLDFPLSQLLAAYLFEKGVKDDIYFEEMAKYAKDAIKANPPEMFVTHIDSGGKGSAKVNPEFEAWCGDRSLQLNKCRRLVLFYGNSLNMIRGLEDPRAIPILRNALKMSASAMVGVAVAGLGLLNDVESLPLIAQTCSRFPPVRAQSIAIDAIDYKDARVDGLFSRFIQDRDVLEKVRKEWQSKLSGPPTPDKE